VITNYHYIGDFHGERSKRIGASEIPCLFPNPEKPTESLAGYDQTAITLYKKKTGEKVPFTNSLAAEMGHFLENKSLELFIRRFFGAEIAKEFIQKKIIYEMDSKNLNAEDYQVGLFRHNVEYYHEGMIVHPDLIYLGNPEGKKVTVEGVMVDTSKPFYVEAKSARKEATKRREESYIKGYDFESTTWQGIPLKHYVQMQYQSALLEIDTGYLPLLHNTSEFQVWKIDKSKTWQKKIINIVGKMLKHIELKVMPKELAICLSDVLSIYPTIKKDFINVSGEKAEKIKSICDKYNKANKQIKNWESEKKDAQDAMAVISKGYEEVKSGSDTLFKWTSKKGSEKLNESMKDMKKNDPARYRYLERHGKIKVSGASKYISVKCKS
jgi:hypothetical protein